MNLVDQPDDSRRRHGEKLLSAAVDAYETGRFDECLALSVEAEELFTVLGDERRVLAARQRQAMVWALQGDLGAAMRTNRQLVELYTALGDEISAAKCANNLAYNLRLLGRHDEAAETMKAALAVFRRHPDRAFETAMLHMNLAIAHRMAGNHTRSYGHARRGERLFAGLVGAELRVVDCVRHAATALARLGRIEESDAFHDRAVRVAEQVGNRAKIGALRHSRATELARAGRHADALDQARAALPDITRETTPNINYLQMVMRNITRLYRYTGQPDAGWPFIVLASRLVGRTLSGLHDTAARARWREEHAEIYDLACGLLVARESWAELAVMVETARAQQPVADDLPLDRLLPRADGADRTVTLGPLPEFSLDGARVDLAAAVDDVLADLGLHDDTQLASALADTVGPDLVGPAVELRELARTLAGGRSLMWGTLVLRTSLYWYVIDADGVRGGVVDTGPGSALHDALAAMAARTPTGDDDHADRIRGGHDLMTGPVGTGVASLLVPECVHEAWSRARAAEIAEPLLIVPAAPLARLPVAALPMGEQGEPFVRHLRPVYLPSPALAAVPRPGTAGVSPGGYPVKLVVADPGGDLPGARRLAAHGASSLVGAEATRSNLSDALTELASAAGAAATVVFAGHTTSPDDPTRAVLRLSGGDLSAAEWLSLRGRTDFPAPAVVLLLSCSSGGFGVADWYGLATAALAAGAGTVVSTLWPHLDTTSPVDRAVLAALAKAVDPVGAVFDVVEWYSRTAGVGAASSPFVWANYAVISVEGRAVGDGPTKTNAAH